MLTVQARREVQRPIAEVVAYVADLRNETEWNPGARQITRLDDGPIAAGSRFGPEYQRAGALAIEVTECDPPRQLRYLSIGRSMRLTSAIACTETTGSNAIDFTMDVEPSGVLKIPSPLMTLLLGRQFAASADRLQAALLRRA